ncbi:tetratricopeptide repeat protein [uncultured Dokdonia sp.]|uniref:tetratricopeptide repeat protein n=1 Tax=uncultured Dokdonia sp. TaxID=575653 RepID=UPI002612AE49|nr:tetratricopeptide repeat protein [uncultured Dokdonia sp.]
MDEKTILLFDDYLQGALSPEAKKNFESRLETESALKDAFVIFRDVNQHLSHHLSEERATFKDTLKTVADQHLDTSVVPKKEVKVIRFKPLRYLVAACAVILFGAIFWTQMQNASYSDYSFEGTIDLIERGGDESAFAKAEKAFNNKRYNEAIISFDAILANDPDNTQVLFYKGIASVEIADYAKAEHIFVNLRNGNSVFKYKAQWYHALSFLKQGDTERCKQILEELPQEAEDYKKAQELLKKL